MPSLTQWPESYYAQTHLQVIRESNGDYEVAFDNNEGGYNFQKSFSRREFILFYQDYDRLIAIQNTLFRAGLIYKLVDLQPFVSPSSRSVKF